MEIEYHRTTDVHIAYELTLHVNGLIFHVLGRLGYYAVSQSLKSGAAPAVFGTSRIIIFIRWSIVKRSIRHSAYRWTLTWIPGPIVEDIVTLRMN